ncbi:MAG: sodium/solute symporter [Alloprevotella sp.]|nr:sodium/solute symporter [Bacteroidales bacterium]MBR1652567.1 sodium/solute symporter [Alloprevotella sp.]
MKKNVARILFLLILLPLAALAQERFNDVVFTPQQPLAVSDGQGVSAPFAGLIGQNVYVAGGCNFPDTPAAEGGAKVFYKDIFIYSNNAWTKAGELPKPLAYGVGVSTPDGLVCIGGTSDGKLSESAAYLLKRTTDGKASVTTLPALPLGLDQMAGAYGDGFIYVAGGQSDGKGSQKAFRLKYPGGKVWEQLPDMPGAPRVQPCAVVQNGALGPQFYVFGGFDPDVKRVSQNGVVYNPRTGTWSETASLPQEPSSVNGQCSMFNVQCIVGSVAVPSGCGHVLFFGGVNKDIFEAALSNPQPDYLTHPAEWYKFNNNTLVYSTVTDAWCTIDGSNLLARAGAGVATYKDGLGRVHWLVVNGEAKPGVRSADVTDVEMTYTAHFGWLNWLVLILYLVGMIGLGIYFMRRQKGGEDFFKGGGRIPWWAAGISIFATMLSAITYMSIPAKAYATDWTYYPMQICILLVSFPVIKYYLPFFRRLNVTTAYEYLERRFNYATRFMASLLFIVFMVARTALVIFLPSLAMTAVTGIDIYICIVLMAVITIVYCTMGGVEAVVWGDVIQGIILVGGAILAAVYLIVNTEGGADGFWQIATDNNKFQMFVWSLDWKSATFWVVILGGLANNLISYTSDQTVIQRYLTTKDEKSAARGILTNGLMSVVVTIAFFTIGTGLYTFFKTHPAAMDMTMQKTDAIFPFFMMSQLPAGLAGLLIAAVFAATMSTIASNINSISTAFTVDFWGRFRKVSEQGQVKTARIAGVAAGLLGMFIAILMAMVDIQSLLDYFNTILGLLSGGIGGLFLLGIFFPRVGSRAALVGFCAGTATVLWMNFCTPASFLLFGFVSMAVSVLVALLLSFLWPQRDEQQGLTWQTRPEKEYTQD